MNCALCLQSKKLCKSHIIPEFLYRSLYDPNHHFHAIHSSEKKITRHQSGAYESLLCNDCEQKLSKHETYVAETLSKNYPSFLNLNLGDLLHFDIDYKKSRLFYLSVLWRMSISSHTFFNDFSIPQYNEILRNLIFNDDPGGPEEFGCSASIPLINNSFRREWILAPHVAKLRKDDICYVVLGGVLYIFFITFKNNPKIISQSFIQNNDTWLIAKVDAKTILPINSVFQSAQKILNKN